MGTKTVDAIRSAAKKTAKKDGKARLLAANQAKTEAKLALKKAIQFRKGEKGMYARSKKLARRLKREKVLVAARKTEQNALHGKLNVAKAAASAREAKLNKKFGQIETDQIHAAARLASVKRKMSDLKGQNGRLLKAARNEAAGLHMRVLEIRRLKAHLAAVTAKYKLTKKAHKKTIVEKKKGSNALNNCQRDKASSLQGARAGYTKHLDKLKKKIQKNNTQAQLAKRALQLCENRSKGSGGRATNRVKNRTKRAVRRAKRQMKKKAAKHEMKTALKAKLKTKIKKQLKKKEAKKVAKKFKKLTKKKLSPKCKVCLKLTKAEHKLLGADCKAC